MYPVNSNFHSLSTQDAPKTRVRIYFITDAIDCTDDDEVQTSGTLLVGAAGDTDSNGRVGDDGIRWQEYFNRDKNIEIGAAVSSQIEIPLINVDGALNNFSFGRCKVYLDVYDTANSTWRVCPMGVYIIDLPTKRRVKLISASGYDQMQRFDTICDSWWNGLNWSGGLTLLQILNSMAAQRGVFVSANTASALVNSSVTYTEPPFSCVEVTYREVLEYIAEATGTIARFDRDGYLDLRFFSAAKISGNTVTINADTVGNTCLDIDIAEYQAAAIGLLKVKIAEDDIGVTVGSGTNQYTIVNNLFLYGSTATIITNRATPIYNRLNGLGAYTPIQAKLIYDWSLEAGDIINIVRDSTTYPVLIFQQTLAWRGGYVTADILADGDNVRPVMDYDERASYRMASEMSQKVGDNEIISKINQTAESIQIQASRVDLAGYVTFTNLSTSGQTTINGGNITTGTIDASTVTVSNINASNISSGTLSAARIAAGSLAIGKLDSAAQNTINGANSQEQLIYRSKTAGTTSLSKTTTWVTNTNGSQDTWTLKRPTYNSSYPVLFVATQRKDVGGTVTCTTPQIDNTTTVIDGGNIITGTVTANQIAGGTITSTNLATALNNTINTAYSNASDALSNAATAQSTADSANSQEQLIYISKVSGTTTQSGTTTWVTNATGNQNTWTIKRPTYNSSYPVLFVATQRKNVAGTVTCTTPQIDNTTTVIDGGHITTGTIDASVVSVTNLNASNITSGTMSASKISGGTLTLGGSNNTNGTMTVKDANGNTAATVTNAGIVVNGTNTKTTLNGGAIVIEPPSDATKAVTMEYVSNGLSQSMYLPSGGRQENGFWWKWGAYNAAYLSIPGGDRMAAQQFAQDRGLGANSANGEFLVDSLAASYVRTPKIQTPTSDQVLTITGFPDVTSRRTSVVNLSTLGWYRAIKIASSWRGGRSFAVDIFIGRNYNGANDEIHKITLLANWDSFAFVNETSKSNTKIISAIRYTHDSNSGYIDIKYGSLTENAVYADFDVHCHPDNMANFTAQSLQSVADSPSGETVLTTYSFADNTETQSAVIASANITSTNGTIWRSESYIKLVWDNEKAEISGYVLLQNPASGILKVSVPTPSGFPVSKFATSWSIVGQAYRRSGGYMMPCDFCYANVASSTISITERNMFAGHPATDYAMITIPSAVYYF